MKNKLISGILLTTIILPISISSALAAGEENIKILPPSDGYNRQIFENKISLDYKYNQEHFFTKKIKIFLDDNYKNKDLELRIIEGGAPIYYMKDNLKEETKSKIKKVYDIKKLTEEIIIENPNIDGEEGKNYMVALYDNDKQISNNIYLYFGTKENFLNNMLWRKYPGSYININDKVYEILKEIEEKYGTKKYIEILNKLQDRINVYENVVNLDIKKIIKNIKKESDFQKYLKDYKKLYTKLKVLKSIKYIIGKEISEKQSDEVINDIFKDYQ